MRTIEVIFTNKYMESVPTTMNKYFFLCASCEVCVGDLITDKRYDTSIQVVNILDTDKPRYKGITLKLVHIDAIKHLKRTISITLKQAQEWYNSDNGTLKQLALTTYNELELANSYDYICQHVNLDFKILLLPSTYHKSFTAISKLSTIACYYNGVWEKTESNTGYFIGKSRINVNITENSYKNIYIFKHDNVKYPGIVYFKNKEDAIKALHMLNKKDLNNLF